MNFSENTGMSYRQGSFTLPRKNRAVSRKSNRFQGVFQAVLCENLVTEKQNIVMVIIIAQFFFT